MPYVIQEKRPELNKVIKAMVEAKIKADGDLNYILFKFAKHYIPPSYNNYKNFLGELNECVAEIRRKILGEYEDKKEIENGSI